MTLLEATAVVVVAIIVVVVYAIVVVIVFVVALYYGYCFLGFKKSHIDISNFLGGLNTSLPTKKKKLGIFPKFLPRFLCFVLDPPHTVCTLCLSSPQPPVCAFHSSPPVCAFRSSHPVHVFFSSSPLLVGFVHPPLFIHLIPHL